MANAALATEERRKYAKAWAHPQYRVYSPGEQMLPFARPFFKKPGTLVDIGCGTGRAGAELAAKHDVTLMDFIPDAVEVEDLEFVRQNLWTRWPGRKWDYGYCCDVMEHMPPAKVDAVLTNIQRHTGKVFFSIHFDEDQFGAIVGHPLHLTVKPFTWWRDKLREYWRVKDARDLIGMGAFYCV